MATKLFINGQFLINENPTGVHRFASNILSEFLNEEPSRIRIISPKGLKSSIKARYADCDVKVLHPQMGALVWEQVQLVNEARDLMSPDLLNLTNTAPVFYKNNIITLHDLAYLHNPKWFKGARYWIYYKILLSDMVKRSKGIITVSNAMAEEIAERLEIPMSKIEVASNSVPEEFVLAANMPKTYILPKNFPDRFILTVGSRDPRKNVARLLEAFKLLRFKDVGLVVVGPSVRAFSQEDIVDIKNDFVHFTGRLPDHQLAWLYKKAELFVYPSLYEGFGIPCLEAMYCGCPVLTSTIPALRETCADAAEYCDANDVNDIASKILSLLRNSVLRESLSWLGRERCKSFSWQQSARVILNAIDKW